jgi:diguanylate cyclase (GGDEF)-like protein/PAS domain S-box-containing protein
MQRIYQQVWQQLGLSARLIVVLGVAMIILSTAYFALVVSSEIKFYTDQLRNQVEYELEFVAPTLAEPAVVGDYGLIQQVLDVRIKQKHVVYIAWVDDRGHRIRSKEKEVVPLAPRWFVRWLALPVFEGRKEINVGGMSYGWVEIRLTATQSINSVWSSLHEKLEILLLCMGVLFALTISIVSNASRPLHALSSVARRFGQGDHSARMTPFGPPEAIECILAFNTLADNIETLLRSLRDSDAHNKRLALIVEQSSEAILTINQDGFVTSWNAAASVLYGYSTDEAIGQSVQGIFVRDLPFGSDSAIAQPGPGRPRSVEERHLVKSGTTIHIVANLSPLHNENNESIGEIVVIRDVTRQKAAEEALFKETERVQVTLASIADAVITTDTDDRIEYLNPVAERLVDWSNSEARGEKLSKVFNCLDVATSDAIANPIEVLSHKGGMQSIQGNAVLIARDGQEIPIQATAALIFDRKGEVVGSVLVFRDVSSSHSMAQELTWQATHDALTSLVNRREFARCLESMADSAERENREHAMLYLDLDQFKVVNDTCGHLAGDELLRQLSSLLSSRVRASDTLARLGGDEFGVLLRDCNAVQAAKLAESLLTTVADFRFAWEDKIFTVGVSIGVVPIKGKGQNNADIMALADAACYQAKDNGRNRIEIAPQDKALAHRRNEMLWVSRINSALEDDRLVLYYQEIAPLTFTGKKHYEVLIRMLDEDGKLVMPMAFIPAAERYNLMHAVDRRVIAKACQMLQALDAQEAPAGMLTISINLSGISLSDEHLLPYIQEQFAIYRVRSEQVCFEITETAAVANLSKAVILIKELRAMGCRFSLDDFGSGLSSFTYLKNLPVDFLKIDGSFVRDMAQDPIDAAMVRAIGNIGHVMGIQTIAEWVEDEKTMQMLRDMGIDYAQGYFIGKPAPIHEMMATAAIQDAA